MHQIRVIRTTYRNYGRRNVFPLHSEEWGIFSCEPAFANEGVDPVEIAVELLQVAGAMPGYHIFSVGLTYNAPSVDDTGAGDVDSYVLEGFTEEEERSIFEAVTGLKSGQ